MVGVVERLRAEHPEHYCPDCLHLWRVHQDPLGTQRVAVDDPVPCYAAVGWDPDLGHGGRFVHCGCRALLDPEVAREVRRRQLAQGREQRA